ncbi:DNA polymerase III subunit alpha [bacterium]|nr:MAG: DNA polymerase III subunit alpha [bacterium]
MIHLDVRSWNSHLSGASEPKKLAAAAAYYNHGYLALTDWQTTAGLVQHAVACRDVGIKPILGTTLNVSGTPLVVLTTDRESFGNMTDLLTLAHRDRENPHLTLEQLEEAGEEGQLEGLVCLTGDRTGFTMSAIRAGRYEEAKQFVLNLKRLFPARLYMEQVHQLRPGDNRMLRLLDDLGGVTGVPTVATNAVRHATRDDYALYDALTCARLCINVGEHHMERPVNNQGYLCSRSRMAKLPFSVGALARGYEVAEMCSGTNLLAEKINPPEAYIPRGFSPDEFMEKLCREALPVRYKKGTANYENLGAAKETLKKELEIIRYIGNAEFFLVVREVMEWARTHGIRCSGRGSAANSIVAYLLRITNADPIRHRLMFERFLHKGHTGTPDIDVDFDSSRREHVISWLNRRFKETHTAMTANVITFQLKLAVREMMKVLGFPEPSLALVAKVLPHWSHKGVRVFQNDMAQALNIRPDAVLLETLCELVSQLGGCPRHLSIHSGGMVLSRSPLRYFTAIRTSANGTRQVEFNKDDVEELGIVKLDVLGLRMLSTISEAVDRLDLDCNIQLDIDDLPEHDEPTYEMIRTTKTLGVFQIESPGQMRLLSETQPESFRDLVVQVALFRPGPLQGQMVSPYIMRRHGLAPDVPHPSLLPILKDTFGIIIFQEQVLEIVHQFANYSHIEADQFRRLMSKSRDPVQMESKRPEFVSRAVSHMRKSGQAITEEQANQVFNTIAPFVGYGFCRSHAVAFANIVYQSAYLKRHHPAAHFCAVLEHHPGFYPTQTLLQEARACGVTVLPVDARFSDLQYRLERLSDEGGEIRYGIRLPFKEVKGISEEGSSNLVWERFQQPFASLEDMFKRVRMASDEWDALARVGALTAFAQRRGALWELGLLRRRVSQEASGQQMLDFPLVTEGEVPALPQLPPATRTNWDYELQGITAGVHPVSHHRPYLDKLKIRPLVELLEIPAGRRVRTAGVVVARQRPPTAKGFCFVELEDETGLMQVALPPQTYERFAKVVREPGLVVEGILEGTGGHRSILGQRVQSMQELLRGPHVGGYSGFPGQMAH